MSHPFLAADFLVKWSQLTPDHIEADVAKGIAEGQVAIDAIAAQDKNSVTYDSVLQALEDATELLNRVWGRVNHLDSVCNSDALREAKNVVLPQVTEFYAKIPLNADLWSVIKAYAGSDEGRALTGQRRRYLDETVADFEEAGADLPDDKKTRLQELSAELATVTQKYGENALDATNAWELVIDDPDKLAGLPEREIAAARASAAEKGLGTDAEPKWRFTLQYPSWIPVMRFVEDADIRKTFWQANSDVAAVEPHDNSDLIWQILGLRQEKAELLGKANFADHVLTRRMAKDGATALAFVEDLFGRSKTAFDREVTDLQQFKADAEGGERQLLEPWEGTYWSEKQRKALYDFDDEEVRRATLCISSRAAVETQVMPWRSGIQR
jgi:oligopeptidase A